MKGTLGPVIKADVLVIGGGIAGLFAAIKAKEKDPKADVTLVDKAYPGRSGCSVFAAGVFPHWMPGDPHLEEYIREIVQVNSEYLIDQRYVEVAVKESYDRFQDLVKFGVEFARDAQGRFKRVPTLTSRFGFCTPFAGGPHLMWKVRAEAERRGVRLLDRIMVTELLTRGAGCSGAVGFGIRDGEYYIFLAKGTVLAAGSCMSYRAPMGASGGTGDGPALAFRAGAPLSNMEQFKPNYGPKNLGAPGLHVFFGKGAVLVNALGKRFMENYRPELKEEARRYDTVKAIVQEWKEGRGPCYLDCTHLPAENIETIKRSLPLVMKGLKMQGLDIARDKVEMIPYGLNLLHMGGAKIKNASGQVGIPGLWVVGAAGDYCGGCDSTPATTLAGSSVQGARAGGEAARGAKGQAWPKLDSDLCRELKRATFAPLKRKVGKPLSPDDLIHKILEIRFRHINIVRSESSLNTALKEIDNLKGKIKEVTVRDSHQLQNFHNAKNMLELTEVTANACLLRTESRATHFRADYPQRDDANWLKWIVARLRDGEINYQLEEIPLGNWKFKPSHSSREEG